MTQKSQSPVVSPASAAAAVVPLSPEQAQQREVNVTLEDVAPVAGNAAASNNHPSTASIYVGELHPDVTESMLFELFSQVGPVASIRVCRDAVTRRSLGYAYVNYHDVADGERALEVLNYVTIKGRACRLMWSQRDPSLRRSGTGNVFIKNLDKAIDNKALHDTFSAFGNILSCKVVCDESGASKGFGFVHFETLEAAEQAIEKVNGMELNDKIVFVGLHVPKRERESKSEALKAQYTNLYVKHLEPSVDDAALLALFAPFGEIVSAVVQRDTEGQSRLFGFIQFLDHEAAQKAVEALHDKILQGISTQPLYVGRAQKKSEREESLRRQYEQTKLEKMHQYQGVNLYVKNLDERVDDAKLEEEFGVYGVITSAKVMRDERGVSKGFGFVCYTLPEEASKAVTEVNGRLLFGKPIYVALAQRKEVRRSQLEIQHQQRAQLRLQQQLAAAQQAPFMYAGAPGGFYPGPPPSAGAGGRGGAPGSAPFFYPAAAMMASQAAAAARPRWPGPPNGMPGAMNGRFAMPMMPMSGGAPLPPRPMRRGPGPMSSMPPQAPHPQQHQQHQQRSAGPPRPMMQPMMAPHHSRRMKYNPSMPMPMMPMMPPHPGHVAATGAPHGLTAAALASAPPEQQKQMLGERLFPLVQAREGDLAGKITGMLLEMDNSELLHLLESHEALSAKVAEAVHVLQHHLMTSTGTNPNVTAGQGHHLNDNNTTSD